MTGLVIEDNQMKELIGLVMLIENMISVQFPSPIHHHHHHVPFAEVFLRKPDFVTVPGFLSFWKLYVQIENTSVTNRSRANSNRSFGLVHTKIT